MRPELDTTEFVQNGGLLRACDSGMALRSGLPGSLPVRIKTVGLSLPSVAEALCVDPLQPDTRSSVRVKPSAGDDHARDPNQDDECFVGYT
jgi:hypothetical protein